MCICSAFGERQKLDFEFGLYPDALLTLHLGLAFVKGDIALDLVHAWQRVGIVPRCVLHFGLVGRDGVVRRVAFVGAVRLGGCRA
jgi:hypothetical protein